MDSINYKNKGILTKSKFGLYVNVTQILNQWDYMGH